MATNIFLGLPPPNVVKWIRDNYKPDMTKVPLHFTANEDNSSVSLVCYDGSLNDFIDSWFKLDYSMDGKTWQAYIDPVSQDKTLHRGKVIGLSKGETVYFKATLGNAEGNPNLDGFSRGSGMIWHYFIMEGSIKADGNIQFLLESTGTKMDVPGRCYSSMFEGCTSLTQAPTLPATILTDFCYYKMFSGCTSLNSINVNFSAWDLPGATYDWVYNVSSPGTFTCPAGLPEEFGSDRIPSGWTVVKK